MTTLVFGVAGAVVGNAILPGIGGQIGFLLGTFIGNLIDPPKVEGPRRTDLKLQVAEYGRPIPYVWGTGRLAGVVCDQTDLQEHKQTSGGKGGPEQTTYTYSASFLVKLAHRLPTRTSAILGVNRIWADTRLIWDGSAGDTPPCTVYLGTTTQTPDPTFEAIHGVGNQPGYRNDAYVTFTDYALTDFGDRIPALEFEIFTKVGTFPWRVSTFSPDSQALQLRLPSADYSSGTIRMFYGARPSWHSVWYRQNFDIDGNELTSLEAYDTIGTDRLRVTSDWDVYFTGIPGGGWSQAYSTHPIYVYNNPIPGGITNNVSQGQNMVLCGNGFATFGIGTGGMHIIYWGLVGKNLVPNRSFELVPGSGVFVDGLEADSYVGPVGSGASPSGFVFGVTNLKQTRLYWSDASASPFTLHEYAVGGGSLRSWDLTAANAIRPIINGGPFVVYRSARTGKLIFACDAGIAGNKQVYAYYLEDDLTLTEIGGVNYGNVGIVTLLGNSPFVLTGDGVISLEPPTAAELLADIVSDISALTNVGTVDVTELTPEVRWFTVANQMEARNAIEELRRGFLFDGVEVDDAAVFKQRGATDSIVTVDDDDLCVVEYGGEPPDPLTTKRRREIGMPRSVAVQYIDVEADYQVGLQTSHRITTLSDSDVSLDLAIGFTASEAKQKAEALLTAEWTERESFEWSTTRAYAWVKPADVVTVRGRVIRIRQRTETPDGVLKWEGVQHRGSIYDQTQESSGGGFVPQSSGSAPDNAATECVLLDIPILSQTDNPFGFYSAGGPATAVGNWPGYTLYKSVDGGITYNAIAASNVVSIIGTTVDYLAGSPNYSGALASYGGGDVVDESSIVVTLTDDATTLASINATALVNGGNLCAISRGLAGSPATLQWELLNFRDAVLVAPQTYVLTGFLRGRKNTQTGNHSTGDTFVFLPVTNVNAPESELNKTLWYKAVTYGKTLASASPFEFTNTGLSALEYYGTENEHQPPFTGDTGSPSAPSNGLVPAPQPGDCAAGKFLSACGTWEVPSGSGGGSPSGSGGGVVTKDEGITVDNPAAVLDFVGPVQATGGAGTSTVTLQTQPTLTPGTYGNSVTIGTFTVDKYGLVTDATNVAPIGHIITANEGVTVDSNAILLDFRGPLLDATDGGFQRTIITSPDLQGVGVTVASGGSPNTIRITGAPIDASYVVIGANTSLTNERVLTAGTGISLTDGGAGGAIVVATTGAPGFPFSTGEDGNLTASAGTTTMTRDMYYGTITLTGTAKIVTDDWLLHANIIDLSGAGTGAISSNGNNGNAAVASALGTGGTAPFSRSTGAGTAGTNGGGGTVGTGIVPVAAAQVNPGNGGRSNAGGAGGVPGGGLNGARNGTNPAARLIMGTVRNPPLQYPNPGAVSVIGGGNGAPGGTSGSGDASTLSGGGGGGGAGGNMCAIYVGTLIVSGSTGTITAFGGNGGNGGTAPAAAGNAGGGGGGAGGGGGWVYLVCGAVSGSGSNVIKCNGGDGGIGGGGVNTGGVGADGAGGDGGFISYFNISLGTATFVAHNALHSGRTGGVAQLSLP